MTMTCAGPLTATGGLELGPVRRLSAQLKGKFRFEHGRAIELGALWSEKTGATVLSLVGQPHPNLKLTSTYALQPSRCQNPFSRPNCLCVQ